MKKSLMVRLRRNPYPLYEIMRKTAPVFRDPLHDLWMLFDYESVRAALADNTTFSSRAAPPGGAPLDWLIFQDPPVHTKLRGLIMRTFTPRAIAGLESRIADLSRELLDRATQRGEMDLAGEYSIPLPIMVIAEMIGIPLADRARFIEWSQAILGLSETIGGGERAEHAKQRYRAAKEVMRPYVSDLLAERRSERRDDLLTRLVEAEVDGERLNEEEILSFFQLLLLAGSETTTNLIGNAMLCFMEHPHELAKVRADPALVARAIEEVLRFRTPVQILFRMTTRDVEMRGKTIPAGKLVLLMVGSANRDSAHFRSPGRFDISRAGTQHVGFGHGIHFCIGAALARLEARVALTHLLDRLDSVQLAEQWEPVAALNVHGPARLPIRFTSRKRARQRQHGAHV